MKVMYRWDKNVRAISGRFSIWKTESYWIMNDFVYNIKFSAFLLECSDEFCTWISLRGKTKDRLNMI